MCVNMVMYSMYSVKPWEPLLSYWKVMSQTKSHNWPKPTSIFKDTVPVRHVCYFSRIIAVQLIYSHLKVSTEVLIYLISSWAGTSFSSFKSLLNALFRGHSAALETSLWNVFKQPERASVCQKSEHCTDAEDELSLGPNQRNWGWISGVPSRSLTFSKDLAIICH